MLLEQDIYENDGFHKINYEYPSKKDLLVQNRVFITVNICRS